MNETDIFIVRVLVGLFALVGAISIIIVLADVLRELLGKTLVQKLQHWLKEKEA